MSLLVTNSFKPRHKGLARFALGLLVYIVPVILWGAFVRASLSGDGCGDHWPLCDGELVPLDPTSKKAVEFTHRVTSGFAWIFALVGFVWARRLEPKGSIVRRAAGWVLVLMTTEALVGAAIVVLRMVASNPEVARAGWMAAHLVNTFVLLGALTMFVRATWYGDVPRLSSLRRQPLLSFVLLALLMAGMSGAIAALGDTLFPSETLAEALAQDLSPTAHLFIRLRIWHPVLALGAAGLTLYLCASLWAGATLSLGTRRIVLGLAGLIVLQVGAGLLNVVLLAPVWMQLVHLLLADMIWVGLIWLWCERATESTLTRNGARI